MTSIASPLMSLVTVAQAPGTDPSVRHNVYTYKSTKKDASSRNQPVGHHRRLSFSISSVEGRSKSEEGRAAAVDKRKEKEKALAERGNNQMESSVDSGASTPLKRLPKFLNLLPNRLMPVKRTPVVPPSKIPVPYKGTEASALEKITKHLTAAKTADQVNPAAKTNPTSETKPVVESKTAATNTIVAATAPKTNPTSETKPVVESKTAATNTDPTKFPICTGSYSERDKEKKKEVNSVEPVANQVVIVCSKEDEEKAVLAPVDHEAEEKSKPLDSQKLLSARGPSPIGNESQIEKTAEVFPTPSALEIEDEESWRKQGHAEYHHTSAHAISQRVGSSRGRDDMDVHREMIRSADGDREYHIGSGRASNAAVKPVEVRAVEEQRCPTPTLRSITISAAPVLVDTEAVRKADMVEPSPSNNHRFNDDGSAGLAADFRRNGFHRDRDILRKASRKRVHHLYPIAVPCPTNSNSPSERESECDEEEGGKAVEEPVGYLSARKEQYKCADLYPALPSVQLYPHPPGNSSDRHRLGKPPLLEPIVTSQKGPHGNRKSKVPARLPSVQPNPTNVASCPQTQDELVEAKMKNARLPKVEPISKNSENAGPSSSTPQPSRKLMSNMTPRSAAVQADLLSFRSEDFSENDTPKENYNNNGKNKQSPVYSYDDGYDDDFDGASYTYDEETGEHYYYDEETSTYYFYDQETGEYYYYDEEAETYFFYDDELNEYYYYDEEAGEYYYCEGDDEEYDLDESVRVFEDSGAFDEKEAVEDVADDDDDCVSESTVEYLLVKSVRRRRRNLFGNENKSSEKLHRYPVAVLEGWKEGDAEREENRMDSDTHSSNNESKPSEKKLEKKKSLDHDRDQRKNGREGEADQKVISDSSVALEENRKKKKKSVEFQTIPTTTVIEADANESDESYPGINANSVGRRRPVPNAIAPPDPPSPCRYDVDEHPSVRPPSVEELTRSAERARRRKSSEKEKSRSNSLLKTEGKESRNANEPAPRSVEDYLASRSDSINVLRYHRQHHDMNGAQSTQRASNRSPSPSTSSSMYILIPLDSASEQASNSVASRPAPTDIAKRKSSSSSGKKEKKSTRGSRDNSFDDSRARSSRRDKDALLVPSSFFATAREADLRRAIHEEQQKNHEVETRRRSRPHTSPSEFHTIPVAQQIQGEKKEEKQTDGTVPEKTAAQEKTAAPEKSKVSRLVERKRSLKSSGGEKDQKTIEKSKEAPQMTSKKNTSRQVKRTTEAAAAAPQDRVEEPKGAPAASRRARQAQQRRKQMILAYKAVTSDRIPEPPKDTVNAQNADDNEAAPSSTAWNTLNPNYTRASHRPPQYLFPLLQQPKLPKKPTGRNESGRRKQRLAQGKKSTPRTLNREREWKLSKAAQSGQTNDQSTQDIDGVSKWHSPREEEGAVDEPYLLNLLPTEVDHDGTWLDGSLQQKPTRPRPNRRSQNPFESLIMKLSPYNYPIKRGGFAQTAKPKRRRVAPQRKKRVY